MAQRQLDVKSQTSFNKVDEKREATFKISYGGNSISGTFPFGRECRAKLRLLQNFASAVLFGVTNDISEQQWDMCIQLTFGAILDTEHA